MSDQVLLYTVANGVAVLTLNRPEKRNALNRALVDALAEGLARAAEDEEVRLVMIRGMGKDFCSGADLAEMERMSTLGKEENVQDALALGSLFTQIRTHPRPVVAAVKGRALAGGCGLATACDIVLARDDAEFGYPEVHLGFVPAMVMTILRRKVPEGRAFELMVSGARLSAEDAERIGFVTRVFPAFTFSENVKDYLAELVEKPPSALTLTKRLLYELDALDFERGIERAAEVNAEARMTEAAQAGFRNFLERARERAEAKEAEEG